MPANETPRYRTGDNGAALVVALLIVSGWFLPPPPPARAVDNDQCFACHQQPEPAVTEPDDAAAGAATFVDREKYAASIHADLKCISCHTDIKELPHPERLAPVSCKQCHRIESDIYLQSDHGVALSHGVTEAATCQACHGDPHELLNYRNPDSPVHRINIHETCAGCHADTAMMEKFRLSQRSPIISYDRSVHGVALLEKSVSASAVCTDCHGSHDLHRSNNPASKLYWQQIPRTCGKCHENVERTFGRSVHGRSVAEGNRDAPVCTDCHGEHTILPVQAEASRVYPAHITETCGQCHGAERIATRYEIPANVVETYMHSFHGLGGQLGNVTVANCGSCHGHHDILPASDPLSSINPANLPQTCGKCHPGIGTRLAFDTFRMHAPPGAAEGKPWLVNLVARIYVVVIVITIGGMLVYNLVDYAAKARRHVRAVRQLPQAEQRLSRLLRLQHAALIVLFAVLAYTGFVHKYPEAWWSLPIQVMDEDGSMRRLLHRVAGWTFAGLFGAHLVALCATVRGREYLRLLWLRVHDARDCWVLLLCNLGRRQPPPPARRFNFAEKVEYWALLWGSLVMTITGVMLIFTETVLRMLPKVCHDLAQVIHFYEAVLATLAIVVWHFYWVIFDPKEYPMNPAWIIGTRPPHSPQETGPVPPTEPKPLEEKAEPPDET